MSDSPINIETPDNVVEITIARRSKYVRKESECRHQRVELDEMLLEVTCRDCKVRINPVQFMIDRHQQFQRHIDQYERYRAALAAYDKKTRCKCEHCGRITRVREPTPKEIEMERRARIAEGSLLEVKP